MKQNFKADKPFAKLATDITEFKVEGRKLYLSTIIDLFNGGIVTYKMSENPNFNQVKERLQKVFPKWNESGTLPNSFSKI